MPPKKNQNNKGKGGAKSGSGGGGGGALTKKEYQAKLKAEREFALEQAKDREQVKAQRAEKSKTGENNSTAKVEGYDAHVSELTVPNFVGLHHSVMGAQGPQSRRFYPGAPKWHTLPNFFQVVQHEWRSGGVLSGPSGDAFENEKLGMTQLRRFSKDHRLLNDAYAEAGYEEPGYTEIDLDDNAKIAIKDHIALFKKAGWELTSELSEEDEWTRKDLFKRFKEKKEFKINFGACEPTQKARPPKCHHCKKVIEDDDPPECVCTQIYCSDLCHQKDWPVHKKECATMPPLMAKCTEFYWQRVFYGSFPCKESPDFVAQWREKGVHDAEQELQFYLDTERPYVANEMQEYLEKRDGTEKSVFETAMHKFKTTTGDQGAALTVKKFFDMIFCHKMRYVSPMYDDSPARLRFKTGMQEVFHTMAKDFTDPNCGVDFGMPSRDSLRAKFGALIEEREDWANGFHPSYAATSGNVNCLTLPD